MRLNKIFVLFFLPIFFSLTPLKAGIYDEYLGGRSAALGFTSITLNDFWSAINNQAGLALINKISVGVFVENKFLLKSLNTKSFAVVKPFSNGGIAIAITQFGETSYNETMISASYGLKLSKELSVGIQLFRFSINQSEYSNPAEIFSFQGGFIYNRDDRMRIAFHIFNPKMIIKSKNKMDLPEIVKFGFSYHLSETLQAFIEVQSHSSLGNGLNSGIEYHDPHNLAFRIGYSSINEKLTFGIGLKIKNLTFDIASSMHSILGYSPQLSLTYQF